MSPTTGELMKNKECDIINTDFVVFEVNYGKNQVNCEQIIRDSK